MKRSRRFLSLAIIIVFIVLDVWNGNTYHFMKVESMLYLSFFFLLLAAVLLLNREGYKKFINLFTGVVITFLVVFLVGGLMSSRVLNARRYARVLKSVDTVEFNDLYGRDKDVQMSFVDKESAILSAEKKIGELSDVSARFQINSREFAQINYQGEMVRVAPFKYSDPFKQWINFGKGVPYYVRVTTGSGATNAKSEIVHLDKPMKYYPGAPLHYNLKRHVAFKHKFRYIDDWHFEIDEEGHPYWIVSVIRKEVGLWGAKNIEGIIVVDAVTGKDQYYPVDKAPDWVDLIYPSDMLLSHAQDHYALSRGYINAMFQQEGIKQVDQDVGTYNYVLIDGEVFVFTGLRPMSLEEGSTTGLIYLSNRDGKALVLDIPGISLKAAEETSVGSIQEKNYIPTTPVLQNIGGYPTYVLSLKDQSGVIRAFSFVNYQDYTKSSVGVSLKETEKSYLAMMVDQEALAPEASDDMEGTISAIQQVYIDGNTIYYIKFEEHEGVYQASVLLDENLPFYQAGQSLSFKASGFKITQIIKE